MAERQSGKLNTDFSHYIQSVNLHRNHRILCSTIISLHLTASACSEIYLLNVINKLAFHSFRKVVLRHDCHVPNKKYGLNHTRLFILVNSVFWVFFTVSGRVKELEKRRLLDEAARRRRVRKALEALEQDNYQVCSIKNVSCKIAMLALGTFISGFSLIVIFLA